MRTCLVSPLAVSLLAFSLVVLSTPVPARACGGFFCQRIPVVQAGEQIVYAIDDDGSLTMTVRIYYEGEAPEFAWILPVLETPAIELGAPALFEQLDAATAPRFYVGTSRLEGTCRAEADCEFPPRVWADGGITVQDASASSLDSGSGTVIYSMGTLGPYETVVIGGTSATEIRDWLTANGYDLPATAIPLLDAYVSAGQRFVALRLRNDATVSEIQPISLRFGTLTPCLPIRLTAIATQPDLPITAFFLARTRATPRNYSLLDTPHPAGLFLGAIDYTSWVSNAVDDVGGQAFAADYAGATPSLSLLLPSVTDLATSTSAEELVRALQARFYVGDPQLLALLTRFITPPMGTDPRFFYNCLANGWGGCGEPATFDPVGLVAAIDETITQPRMRAQAMIDGHAYTTRLFTTMSAEEMTVDPEFVLDDGLGDVSNLHSATMVTECDGDHFVEDARRRLDLPSGESVEVRAARPSGTDADQCARRGGWLRGTDAGLASIDAGFPPGIDGGRPSVGGGGGCSATSTQSRASLALVLGALALALRRRRPSTRPTQR